MRTETEERVWRCCDRRIPLARTLVMGIVNVTPDSFSDGGLWFDAGRAVAHGLELVAEGADLLDVGGESTRPGSAAVAEAEELRGRAERAEAEADELRRRLAKVGFLLREDEEGRDDD